MTPEDVAPTVSPTVAPVPQPQTAAPTPAPPPRPKTRPTRKPAPTPPDVVRRLPTRDPTIVRAERAHVLGVAEHLDAREGAGDGMGALPALIGIWLALGAGLLLLAVATPEMLATTALGTYVLARREQVATAGVYMIAAPALGYLVAMVAS